MFLIVGLGNPGMAYAHTRHNLGFRIVQQVARETGITLSKKGHKARYGEGLIDGEKIILARPQTYVNLSGQSVKSFLQSLGIAPSQLLVIHDDIDLPFGALRLKRGGGSGGHNGIESIIRHIQTDEFNRLKVGVGRPPLKEEPADYVLKSFSSSEKKKLSPLIAKAAEAVLMVIEQGMERAMNEYNR